MDQQPAPWSQDQVVLEERQRLARELHDSVAQAIYSIALHAEAARRKLSAGDLAGTREYLCELQDAAQEALEEMRRLIFELRPPILEQAGLAAALQARLDAVEGRSNLETELAVEGIGELPAPVEQELYRIAQEALNNTLKHARARRVGVVLQRIGDRVTLTLFDDGIGFDPATAGQAGGLGLRGIAERVARLGGSVQIDSASGQGTRIRVELTL
jgi:signal transduction histidine kinase